MTERTSSVQSAGKRKIPTLGERVAKKAYRLFYTLEGQVDAFRLERDFPSLFSRIRGQLNDCRSALQPHYERYVATVSVPWMAASPELSAFLLALCRCVEPSCVADLGSGFSSLVFRLYRAQAARPVTTWSVDTNQEWLNKTREFLRAEGFPFDNVLLLESFLRQRPPRCDIVLHDIGTKAVRKTVTPLVLDLAGSTGLVVLDDMHSPEYRGDTKKLLSQRNMRYYSLFQYTRGRFWRFSGLALRPLSKGGGPSVGPFNSRAAGEAGDPS